MNTLMILLVALVVISRSGATEVIAHFKRQAEILASLPPCIQNCLLSSFSAHGTTCSPTDFSCLCKLQPFIDSCAKCYLDTCTPEDRTTGVAFGQKSCASVGVTLPGVPTPSTPPTPLPIPPVVPVQPMLPENPCITLGTSQNNTLYNGTTFNITVNGGLKAHIVHNISIWSNVTVCPNNTILGAGNATVNTTSSAAERKGGNSTFNAEMGAWSSASKSKLSLVYVFLGSVAAIIIF